MHRLVPRSACAPPLLVKSIKSDRFTDSARPSGHGNSTFVTGSDPDGIDRRLGIWAGAVVDGHSCVGHSAGIPVGKMT